MNKTNYLRKRVLALFLALTMCLSLVQVTAFASEGEEQAASVITDTTEQDTDASAVEEDDEDVSEKEESNENASKDETPAGDVSMCICTTKCGKESVNEDCPVCSAEGADLTACKGEVDGSGNVGDAPILIGDKSYPTLVDAIANAAADDTIVISSDYTEENVNLTISKPVAIQLNANLTLRGSGGGSGISFTDGASLSLTGNGTMLVTGYTYGFSLNGKTNISIAEGTTLKCNANTSSGMYFWGGTSDITVEGALYCDSNASDGQKSNGISVEEYALVSMTVDGGYVSVCDNGWNGMKGSEAKTNDNIDNYETVVLL